MFRAIQILCKLTFAAAIISLGVLLFIYQKKVIYNTFHEWYNEQFLANMPEGYPYREIGAVIIIVWTALAMLPLLPKRRRKKQVTFVGTQGEVTIELQPVEATLERVVTKLPEVKSIEIELIPSNTDGRVLASARGVLIKNAEDDARMITARIQNYLRTHARKILGLQDIDAKLHVDKWIMNMKSLKPEPLLLESPPEEELAQSKTAASAAPEPSQDDIPEVAASDDEISSETPSEESEEDRGRTTREEAQGW